MTTKHTPGPWGVDDDGDVCADDLERLVATVDRRHVSLRNKEALANARLIAAAPDLLHVAEMVLRGAADGALYGFAEAAVRKAKGEP